MYEIQYYGKRSEVTKYAYVNAKSADEARSIFDADAVNVGGVRSVEEINEWTIIYTD